MNHGYYELTKSPLYRLRGKGKFENILSIKWVDLSECDFCDYYRVWENKSGRQIQAPQGRLLKLHNRISLLLSRIELPGYVFSRKGRSYADNAKVHSGNVPVVKTDISRFYSSVTRSMVFKMFLDDFECSVDIARKLADICCYKREHLPTGSSLSGRVAFFAKRKMFDELSNMAKAAGCTMTLYVDDVTISGQEANKQLLLNIRKVIRSHGMKTSDRKSKVFSASSVKTVTGVVLVGDEVRLPNVRHRAIYEARKALMTASPETRKSAQRVLSGRLQEAQQVLQKPVSSSM